VRAKCSANCICTNWRAAALVGQRAEVVLINEREFMGSPRHHLNEFLPDLKKWEYEGLKNCIRDIGLIFPIVLFEGAILDGRHREMACLELGIEPSYIHFAGTFDDAATYVVASVHTQTFDEKTRGEVAAKIKSMKGKPSSF
jgi:hypothetical protein